MADFIRANVFAELHGPADFAGHLGLQLDRRWLLMQCGEQIGSMQIVDAGGWSGSVASPSDYAGRAQASERAKPIEASASGSA